MQIVNLAQPFSQKSKVHRKYQILLRDIVCGHRLKVDKPCKMMQMASKPIFCKILGSELKKRRF